MPRHVSESWRDYLGPGALSSFVLAGLAAVGGVGIPVAACLRRVLRTAGESGAAPADAVLVLGRVLVDNQPSEVFRARLRHGLELWRAGLAPRLIVAGGLTGHASRSEADAGREQLLAWGVPAERVAIEDRSRHTLENLFNVREALRREGDHQLLLVSDPLHLERAATLARGLGLVITCSPATAAPPQPGTAGWYLRALREAYLLHWYHVGVLYSRAIGSERLLSRVT